MVDKLFLLRGRESNPRPQGYEPRKLPAALPRDIKLGHLIGYLNVIRRV